MSIDENWKEANKLLLLVRGDLETLETGQDSSVFLQGRLATNINNLSRTSDTLSSQATQQTGPKKEIWRIRVKQLVEECKNSRQSMDNYLRNKYNKAKEEEERTQLLERRSRAGNNTNLERLYKQGQSIEGSHKLIDDIENSGREILSALYSQNETIKNARTKIFDIANTLGLSQNIIRKIQRRNFVDQMIVYAGMVITLLIIIGLWYYVRS